MAYKPAQATPSDTISLIRYLFRELQRIGQEFYSIAPQDWLLVGDSGGTYDFINGWVNDSSYPLQYRLCRDKVEIRGRIKDGSSGSSQIFTLPEKYRPLYTVSIPVTASGNPSCRVAINSSGAVILSNGSATWSALDGVSFII
tara:strand:+ start:1586 stop:2014 length:429 start_codon:yes stop_codon:yes gene_type:complete